MMQDPLRKFSYEPVTVYITLIYGPRVLPPIKYHRFRQSGPLSHIGK